MKRLAKGLSAVVLGIVGLIFILGIIAIIDIPLYAVTVYGNDLAGWFGALLGASLVSLVFKVFGFFLLGPLDVENQEFFSLILCVGGVVNTFLSESHSPTNPPILLALKLIFFQPFAGIELYLFLRTGFNNLKSGKRPDSDSTANNDLESEARAKRFAPLSQKWLNVSAPAKSSPPIQISLVADSRPAHVEPLLAKLPDAAVLAENSRLITEKSEKLLHTEDKLPNDSPPDKSSPAYLTTKLAEFREDSSEERWLAVLETLKACVARNSAFLAMWEFNFGMDPLLEKAVQELGL